MSGGSYDYVYFKIEELANDLRVGDCPHRLAFKDLLYKVAKAAHDIEWVDSGDYGDGDEIDSIKSIFNDPKQLEVKAAALDRILKTVKEIEDVDNT